MRLGRRVNIRLLRTRANHGFSPLRGPIRPRTLGRAMSNDNVRAFDPTISIRVKEPDAENDDDDGVFTCDEETNMLAPKLGYGYYPVTLGERLKGGKYEIVRKLGWAGYSTVWLAAICDDESPVRRYVAIKVLTVNCTAGVLHGVLREDKSFKLVTSANKKHPGYQHCLKLRDAFVAESHWGPHICFVTDVLGQNTTTLRQSRPNRVLPLLVVKLVIKQILLALDYLHRECSLIHTDVKPDNILVHLGQVDTDIDRHLLEYPSSTYDPILGTDLSPDPIITVRSQPLPNFGLSSSLENLSVQLADYGQAVPVGSVLHGEEKQPALLRAPEIVLGQLWSTLVDIWSVGCLVFEYLVGRELFNLYESEKVTLADVHLERILELIGPFPADFLSACIHRDKYFNKGGSLRTIEKLFPVTLDECIRNCNRVDEREIALTAAFMRRCLTIHPARRPSVLELLEDEWLKGV